MIDFSACPIDPFRMYGGGNGNKIGIIYEGAAYMLKFPPKEKRRVHYTNACLSEYLGCHIYELLGIEAQETLYGIYRVQGKEKKVVACKDFTGDGFRLMEFAKVKNACIGGSSEASSGYATELDAVLEAIERQTLIDPIALKQHFWDMFIVDAYLGNFDRHNGRCSSTRIGVRRKSHRSMTVVPVSILRCQRKKCRIFCVTRVKLKIVSMSSQRRHSNAMSRKSTILSSCPLMWCTTARRHTYSSTYSSGRN